VAGDGNAWRGAHCVVVLAVGAAARVGIAATIAGDDWRTALLRGAIAGGAAVYVHQLRRATVAGDVSHGDGGRP
jgi:hypothetical protein